MSEVEIVVRGRNLAKAAFESTTADVKIVQKSAEDMALSLRRAELAAASAGRTAEQAMARAGAASEKAAASAQAAADAQLNLARGVGSAEYAEKAEATAQADLAAANDKAARSAEAAERASIAQANAAKRAGEVQEAAAAKTEASSGVMAASMERVRNAGKVALGGIVAGAGAVAYESTKMASDWQAQMVKLTTSAHETGGILHNQLVGTIKEVSDGLLKMSVSTATSTDELAKGMYLVESAGFHGKRGLDVMRAAAEGARAEKAPLDEMANALTSGLTAFGLKAKDSTALMNQMISAVGAGKMTMSDFASAISTVLPIAANAKLSFAQIGGAMASITAPGTSAQEATHQLAFAIRNLEAPLGPAQKMMKALGLSVNDVSKNLGQRGLTGTMALLEEALKKHEGADGLVHVMVNGQAKTMTFAAALKQAMGGSLGLNAALNLTGKNAATFNDNVRQVGEAAKGAGAHVQGWGDIQKTFAFQTAQLGDRIKAFGIQIGEKLIPILSDAMSWFSKHTVVLKALAGVVGGVLLIAIGAYTASMAAAAVATIAATWPILAVIAAVAGLVIGFKLLYDHSKAFRDFVHVMWEGIKVIWDQAKKHWDLIVAGIMGPLGILFLYFRTHTDQLKKMWADTWHGMQKAWKEFEGGPLKDIKAAIAELQAFWKAHGQQIMREVQTDWKIISAVISVNLTIIWETVKGILTALMSFWRLTWGLFRDTVRLVWVFMKDFITGAIHAIKDVIALVMDIIHGKWSKVWGDLKKISNDSIRDTIRIIKDLTSNFGTLLYDAGKNIIKGLINGIDSMLGGLKNILSNTASSIRGFFPFSPAKEGPLSGEGSPDKSGAKIASMLADGITAGTPRVTAAASAAAESVRKKVSAHHTRHHHAAHHQPTINQQLTHLAHAEGHMSTAALDKAVEKLMGQHKLTVAQLTKTMQVLLAKGGHAASTKKIDGLIAEMKKQYVGLSSKGILDAAIKELEHHPHLTTSQLMSRVAKDLHAQARKKAASSGSGGGDAQTGYIGDLTWQAGGVRYTVGGAGRSTGPGGTAAGGSSGSASVAAGGSGGQHLTISFAAMHVEIDLKDSSGTFTPRELQGLRKMIRVKGGNVQKVLGH